MMASRISELSTFLKFLENNQLLNFNILGNEETHFINRLKIQKYVYLAKFFGLDLKYNYDMYLHGPYSSDLTEDYYNIAKSYIIPDASAISTFDSESFLLLTRGKDPEWLEIASTLIELSNYYKDVNTLTKKTINAKPHIDATRIRETLSDLVNKRLLLIKESP